MTRQQASGLRIAGVAHLASKQHSSAIRSEEQPEVNPAERIPEILSKLTSGENLTRSEARSLADAMLTGQATAAQMGGMLMALRTKGETAVELAGLLDGLRAAGVKVPIDAEGLKLVDTAGTGGDGSGSLNISTMAALVAAGAGVKLCKHGNRAVSSRCGSADLLEALGVNVELDAKGVAESILRTGLGFCLAPLFHPALRHAGPARRELGVPTAFNYLGPMANPGGVQRQVIGVNNLAMAERMAEVLSFMGCKRAIIVHGHPSLDELSTVGPSVLLEVTEGRVARQQITPEELGLKRVSLADLAGGDAEASAHATRALLRGEDVPWREVVLLNAAAALRVGEMAEGFEDGLELAERSLNEGAAAEALERWVEFSRSLK